MLENILKSQIGFYKVVPFDWNAEPFLALDLTENNLDLQSIDLQNTAAFNDYVFGLMAQQNVKVAVGGYNEHRFIYQRSEHFQQESEPRCIHLGIDIWAKAGTEIYTPIAGKLKFARNNDNFGDYGSTLIIEHELEGHTFHTLYGHLSLESLTTTNEGDLIEAGEKIATIGDFPINGDWPPHLHFQVIKDLEGVVGDYPGVCSLGNREKYLANCPDPNLILRIPF